FRLDFSQFEKQKRWRRLPRQDNRENNSARFSCAHVFTQPGSWPTSIVVPKGYRIALSIRGKDYEWQAMTGAKLSNFKNELRGCGAFLHDDPRKVEVVTGDTAGVPATARTKTQEMVEKNNVHCLIGPLAAFEALAIDDYIRQTKSPTLAVAAAEDMTQRNPNPWFVRATSTSSQCAHSVGRICRERAHI
ncbi:ABC transporter substrate-binding protein, partial [Bradyrhizobium sp.]|uniref:ABC transporter substrate-binding protein n=1 Tax=Bradyrhizobium sp. TaxID=376 RepID=UPI003BB1507B